MNRKGILTKVRELALPVGDWVVHGSGPLVMHWLLDDVNDLDILARGAAWRAALDLGVPEPGRQDLVIRCGPDVEVWSGWLEDDVDELIDSAELMDGVPVVPLAAVLAFKERVNRPKDRPHIVLLREHLGL